MKIHEVQQGTPAWLALRSGYFTASEASAMMGVSKYTSRQELLRKKATGFESEVSESTQALFDRGHAAEDAARLIAEKIIGQELFPATVTDDDDWLLASLDGMTMDETIIFEHKLLNAELVAAVKAGECPACHYWQVVQGLLITGAEKCMFAVSDGTEENFHYVWVTRDIDDEGMLLAGWNLFEDDLKNYQHVEEAPKPVAAAVLDLPAVRVQVTGQLSIVNNFEAFEVALRDFIDNQLIRKPETDQDFADLDAQIKTLKKAEEALNAAEAQMLAQVASVDTMKRTKDMLHKMTRENRLMAEKLLEAEKVNRRAAIIEEGRQAFAAHVAAINAEITPLSLPAIAADFAGVIKGLKSMDSAKNKVSTELARVKIEANRIGDLIRQNLRSLRELGDNHKFLFMDASQLVLKANDDLVAIIKSRIAEHEAAEAAKLEAERERIRAEEEAKAKAEAEAKVRTEIAAKELAAEAELKARRDEQAKAIEAQQVTTAPVAPVEIHGGSVVIPKEYREIKPFPRPRPSDAEIIEAVAIYFAVTNNEAAAWLQTFNQTAAEVA